MISTQKIARSDRWRYFSNFNSSSVGWSSVVGVVHLVGSVGLPGNVIPSCLGYDNPPRAFEALRKPRQT